MSSTTIYLYIKTHKTTGLKYFGKTIKSDYEKYRGSGTYWKNHIAKHGYNVSTEIVFQSTNIDEVGEFALAFSRDNDIVESKEWANLAIENGRNDIIPKGRKRSEKTKKKMSESAKGKIFSEEHKKNISKAKRGRKLPPKTIEHRKKISENNKRLHKEKRIGMHGKNHSDKTKLLMSQNNAMNNPEHRKKISVANKGRKPSAATIRKIREYMKKHTCCCIDCGLQVSTHGLNSHRKGKRCLPTNVHPLKMDQPH
tara:strand:- start:4761 stop:5522 length:762 start_codon:yes stop_codon:yes gene_type:complete